MSPGVDPVLKRLRAAIRAMRLPVVEKISEEESADAFQVLITTMLSAQTRDAVTDEASHRLFKLARTPRTMAKLPVPRIRKAIYPVSFYRNKARHVKATCAALMSRFGGRVPGTLEELLSLPGVGRKTANLVLIVAHASKDNICVDTHVHRISNRLGWVKTTTPEATEKALYDVAARRWWSSINLYLVTWGQNVCRPVYPLCRSCVLDEICPKLGVKAIGKTGERSELGREELGSARRGAQGNPAGSSAARRGPPASAESKIRDPREH